MRQSLSSRLTSKKPFYFYMIYKGNRLPSLWVKRTFGFSPTNPPNLLQARRPLIPPLAPKKECKRLRMCKCLGHPTSSLYCWEINSFLRESLIFKKLNQQLLMIMTISSPTILPPLTRVLHAKKVYTYYYFIKQRIYHPM